MKHMHTELVSFFRALSLKMDDHPIDAGYLEEYDIHGFRKEFMKAKPQSCCPSDHQVRTAANVVFHHGGYSGNSKVWITEKQYLKERVRSLKFENERLVALAWDPSHAAKVLRTAKVA